MTTPSHIRPSLHSQRIADTLAEQIRRGELRDGERLASEAELAREYGVARGTMRSALGILKELDLLHTRPGVGSFIAYRGVSLEASSGWTAATITGGVPTTTEVLSIDQVPVPATLVKAVADTSTATGGTPASPVGSGYLIVRRRLAEGIPVSIEESFLPSNEILDLLMERGLLGGSVSLTMRAAGMSPHSGTQKVCAQAIPNKYVDLLGCQPGERLLVTTRTSYDASAELVEHVVSYLHPDHFTVHIRFEEGVTDAR